MIILKIAIALWVLFTAIWMWCQDIRLERMDKRIKELEEEK